MMRRVLVDIAATTRRATRRPERHCVPLTRSTCRERTVRRPLAVDMALQMLVLEDLQG